MNKQRILEALTALVLGAIALSSKDEAGANVQDYRLCETQISAPPDSVEVVPYSDNVDFLPDGNVSVEGLALTVRIHDERLPLGPDGKPDLNAETINDTSLIAFDAVTAVERKRDVKPKHAGDFAGITASRVSTEPETWPYTDESQTPATTSRFGVFTYREPDPASGVMLLFTFDPTGIIVANCRSTLVIHTDLDHDWRSVDPLDRSAFETFVSQVSISAGH